MTPERRDNQYTMGSKYALAQEISERPEVINKWKLRAFEGKIDTQILPTAQKALW